MSDKVLFADSTIQVHQHYGKPTVRQDGTKLFKVESVILSPGQYVDVDSLAPYLKELAEGEGIPGARVLTLSEAKLLTGQEEEVLQGTTEE